MSLPFLDLARPGLRLLCTFLCLFILFCAGSWLLQQHYQAHQQATAERDAKRMLSVIEQMLSQADHANMQASRLLSRPCEDAALDLRKIAALTTVVRSVSLAHHNAFYCSSIFGARIWSEGDVHYEHGRLRLWSGNPVTPDHPFLSLRQVAAEGEVITTIDADYLKYVLATDSGSAHMSLQVGKHWLDDTGKFSPVPPYHSPSCHKMATSAAYPLSIHAIMTQAPLWQTQITGLVVLGIFSLTIALVIWWLLGRPRSPTGELARAMRAREFVPFLQPLVDGKTHAVRGVEVLMRWDHPAVGIINPLLFIPQAEASGLIAPMTRQLMRRVALDLSARETDLPMGFYVSFNISAACCKDMTLLEECRKFLASFEPGKIRLALELTERETLTNDAQTLSLFQQLDNMGVELAIDDFGTGHSSLLYLQQFRVDTLKIDQSFIGRIGTEALSQHIVDNVIDLGVRLNLKLIAEGVETPHQAAYLRDKGVCILQGYLFGRPMPMEVFFDTLLNSEGSPVADSL